MNKLDTDKKMSKKEKEERVLWKKNEVSQFFLVAWALRSSPDLRFSLLIVLMNFISENTNLTSHKIDI